MANLKVGWALSSPNASSVYFEPIQLSQYTNELIPSKSANGGVSSCPAVLQSMSKMFVIKSPYTFKIRASKDFDGNMVFSPVYPFTEIDEGELKNVLRFQPKKLWRNPNWPVLQLTLPYIFFTDEPAIINQLEAPSYVKSKSWSLIQGRFDIYSWQRPINWAVEWHDTDQDIEIKRGQPLFQLMFESGKLNPNILIKRQEMTEELSRALAKSHGVTSLIKGTFNLIKQNFKTRKVKLIK